MVENQAEADLDRFKAFIEAEATRPALGVARSRKVPPQARRASQASGSRGDAGKAGVSGKAVAAGWA